MPWATALSRLGVAKNTMSTFITGTTSANGLALTAGGTAITVSNVGTATSTAVITIYDPLNNATETVTASALAGSTFTISALANNHPAGCIVSSVGTTSAPTDFLPFTGITPYDEIKWLDDLGIRGSRVETYNQVEGPRFGQFDFAGDVFCDTIGWPLFSVLSDQGYTAGSPSIWTGSTKNSGNGQPTPIEYVDNNSNNTRVYSGVVHEEIAFAFNADGALKYTTKAKGFVSGLITSPTASYTALQIVPAWAINCSIGGVASPLVQDATLTIKPKSVDPIQTLDGSQDPYAFFADAITADGKMTLVYENDAQLNNYLANNKPSLDFTFTRGTGAATEKIQFHMTSCGYRTGKPLRSKSFVELEVDFKALGNTTDAGASGGYSAIKATLNNALTNTGRYQ